MPPHALWWFSGVNVQKLVSSSRGLPLLASDIFGWTETTKKTLWGQRSRILFRFIGFITFLLINLLAVQMIEPCQLAVPTKQVATTYYSPIRLSWVCTRDFDQLPSNKRFPISDQRSNEFCSMFSMLWNCHPREMGPGCLLRSFYTRGVSCHFCDLLCVSLKEKSYSFVTFLGLSFASQVFFLPTHAEETYQGNFEDLPGCARLSRAAIAGRIMEQARATKGECRGFALFAFKKAGVCFGSFVVSILVDGFDCLKSWIYKYIYKYNIIQICLCISP